MTKIHLADKISINSLFAGNSFMELWKMDSRLELKYYAKRCHQSLHASEKCVAWHTVRANLTHWTNGRKVSICIIRTIAYAFLSGTSNIFGLNKTAASIYCGKHEWNRHICGISGIDNIDNLFITLLLSEWDWMEQQWEKSTLIDYHSFSSIAMPIFQCAIHLCDKSLNEKTDKTQGNERMATFWSVKIEMIKHQCHHIDSSKIDWERHCTHREKRG